MIRILALFFFVGLIWCLPDLLPVAMAEQASVSVLVETVEGQQIRADRVVSLEDGEIELDLGSSNQRFTIDSLARMRWPYPDEIAPPLTISLRNGSQLRARSVESTDGDAVLVMLRGLSPFSLKLGQLRAVRYRPASPALDPVWLGQVEEPTRKDTLMIRSSDDSLRPIQGTFLRFDRDKIRFDLSGDEIAAPIDRLEGIVFAALNTEADPRPATFLVEDVNGSRFQSDAVAWREDSLVVTMDAAEGGPLLIPQERLRRIEFRSGVQALIGCDVANQTYSTADVTTVASAVLNQWLGPEVIEQDLAMNAGSQITYRIPSGFDRFVAAVKRDKEVYRRGDVSVQLALDGETVWNTSLSSTPVPGADVDTSDEAVGQDEMTGPLGNRSAGDVVGVDQPIGNARRLTLTVTSDNGVEKAEPGVGDRVQWLRPRLIK